MTHDRFASLDRLLAPASVAVVGASSDPVRIGGRPIAYMRSRGFQGRILPVNPHRAEVQGLPAYPSVAALPCVPDVAVVAVGAPLVEAALRDLGTHGVRAAIVLSAGFAETDADGAALQARVAALAKGFGMRLLGPNCLGLFNARIGWFPIFSSSFEQGWPLPGPIGIASQSGAYGTHLFAACRDRGIGTPVCVTTGNEADVAVADVIGWLARDPDTSVIMAYLEGVQDGATLVAALAEARDAGKPVIVMKVGRSRLGAAAARSHTASIAGDDRVTDAVLRELGAVRARTTEEMIDIADLACRRIYPAGNTLGVLTISGGAGVLVSDAADAHGLPMPAMPEDAQARLRGLIGFCAPANPVDCTAQAFNDPTAVGRFATELAVAGGYRSLLYFLSQVGGSASLGPGLRAQLAAVRAACPDRLHVVSVLAPDSVLRDYAADGFAVFADPSRAVAAIAAMGRLGDAFAAPAHAPALPRVPPVRLPDGPSDEHAARQMLLAAGIACVPAVACASAEACAAAASGFAGPVVIKLLSPDVLHKTEIGGVLLDVPDPAAAFGLLQDRLARAAPAARFAGVLVMPRIDLHAGGAELIMGVHRDAAFGPVALVGLGGIHAELLDDTVLHRCPFDAATAEAMIRSLRGAAILLGARGRPVLDVPAAAAMLSRLSVFAVQAGPRLRAIDLNPVFALPPGSPHGTALAADAVIEFDPGP